ncbi:MAG TPA: hypothetical protein DD458_15340 [Prolixibacteraceae bacterium]|nr:MAG: hypothetical protein A2W92_00875 [Bacteroidetes bacterium GWA2_42_15]HAZ03305.1 hypothetical protein [Marinilabiliales bacterium]HBL76597.1 hypothetical protein [Prolixibacteraceae bacterium]HCU61248.1 hypothetical protein [Prolixibacteraceae bacterium]
MKTYSFYRLKYSGMILIAFFLISMGFFPSCENEVEEEEAYFTIEGNPTGLSVSTATKTESYVVRSNRPWQVVAQSEVDWVQAFPNEGDDDGIFKMIVNENTTFDARTVNFAFIVDGEEQPVLFRVDQEKAVPFLTIADIAVVKNINQTAQDVKINVKANVTYTYNSDATWFTFKKADIGTTGTDLTFSATANEATNSRTANVSFTCAQFPNLNATFVVKQEGKSEGTVVLFEDFNWLAYGSAIFYTTTGETRFDSWSETKGWTSTVNTVTGSGTTPLCYARQGFVKLGKTAYGGDLISPKLSAISGTKNLLVKFKAVPYMTAGGTKDDNTLVVSIIGPGTIGTSTFTIDNWPNYGTDPTCTAIWADKATERSFTITGATSETQIKFLGWDYNLVGVGAGKNRIFLDDIKVLIPN